MDPMQEAEELAKESAGDDFKELAKLAPGTPVAPAHGIAAIALNMAMKYHDSCLVKDGQLYQQYKLEGKNIRTVGLDDVFADAARIEMWLLGASERIAKIVVEALEIKIEDDEEQADNASSEEGPTRPDATS